MSDQDNDNYRDGDSLLFLSDSSDAAETVPSQRPTRSDSLDALINKCTGRITAFQVTSGSSGKTVTRKQAEAEAERGRSGTNRGVRAPYLFLLSLKILTELTPYLEY